MAISAFAGDSEAKSSSSSLLDDSSIDGVVDYKGRPALRSNSGRWRSALFIIGVELAERFAYYGVSSNLISYLTGPLGQSKATAAENVNTWSGVASLMPLFGAFVADSFLGRYRTIIIASVLYILGIGFLTISAELPSLSSSDCQNVLKIASCSPSQIQVIFFFFSLYLMAVAQGGHKPCVQAFGADQFDGRDPKDCESKSSFFNWWYLGLCTSTGISIVSMSYIQDYLSWGLGFGIPCIFMMIALVIFVLGTRTYRYTAESTDKNPFLRIGNVFYQAARNWGTNIPVTSTDQEGEGTWPHQISQQFKFLHKALLTLPGSQGVGEACGIDDVEEAKAVLRLVPIWSTCLAYAVVFAQIGTFFTEQGKTLERSIWPGFDIPAASLQSFTAVSIVFFLLIYDRLFVPLARALTGKHSGITTLQRIGSGMVLSIVSMVVAALVEMKRLETAVAYGLVDFPEATLPMSVWWLVPQYLFFGLADVFTIVGMQEFFYDQVPNDLKSLGLALYLSVIGVGSFLSSFLVSIIEKITGGDGNDHGWFSDNLNRAHLDYFYCLLAGFSSVALVMYLYFAKSYIYSN